MKLVIALTFSFATAKGSLAQCERLEAHRKSNAVWLQFTQRYGAARLPFGALVCHGGSYFAELKNGASMLSALDRRRKRIVLRHDRLALLRHELAHLYIDVRWRVLPYTVSEPLATALAFSETCALRAEGQADKNTLAAQWSQLSKLTECERQQLWVDILSSAPEVRDRLPLAGL